MRIPRECPPPIVGMASLGMLTFGYSDRTHMHSNARAHTHTHTLNFLEAWALKGMTIQNLSDAPQCMQMSWHGCQRLQ